MEAIHRVHASHTLPAGVLEVAWSREGETVTLTLSAPPALHGTIRLPGGFSFADGSGEKPLASGSYILKRAPAAKKPEP